MDKGIEMVISGNSSDLKTIEGVDVGVIVGVEVGGNAVVVEVCRLSRLVVGVSAKAEGLAGDRLAGAQLVLIIAISTMANARHPLLKRLPVQVIDLFASGFSVSIGARDRNIFIILYSCAHDWCCLCTLAAGWRVPFFG